jgi:hypothetical protein
MAIAYSSFETKVKTMLMGNGFQHKGWAVDEYDPETNIHNYSGGPPWIPLQRDTPPTTEKETARFLAEMISEHLLSKIMDPKFNPPLVPLFYRTSTDNMGGITEDLADDIEAGLLELKAVENENAVVAKLKVVFIPMGARVVAWMATNTIFHFLGVHVPGSTPASNSLTNFGDDTKLARDFGLALKQDGPTQSIIVEKVASKLTKAFEDYFGSVKGNHKAAIGSTTYNTNWTGLV